MEIKYRPEIDGLRTVAVLSVIIYHAQFVLGGHKLLPGGFLGVDVFFVISGFLITSLMMKEFKKTGTISVRNFYERRAKRLLPVLLVVMLVSIPFAWMYLLPEQLIDYAKSLISSLLFGSNFYWNYSLQEYGAESSLLKPFLHTWSLAVEEQYYIVFPLILLAIYKWCKSHTLALLTAGLLVSLQFAEWMSPLDASFSFYMLPSRLWELLAGALLANILHLHPRKENDALLKKAMPILGLFLLCYSFIFTEFDARHPGFVTLTPVIGTILVIWFANVNELVTKILSSKPLVSTGLISYSLYLWHYPIFSFGRIISTQPDESDKFFWIAITFVLSILSYLFIEKMFRRNTLSRGKIVLIISTISTIFVFCIFVLNGNGFKDRFPSLAAMYGKNEFDNTFLQKESWSLEQQLKQKTAGKWFSSNKETTKVLIYGNSHGKDLFNAVYQNLSPDASYEISHIGIREIGAPQSALDEFVSTPVFKNSDVIVISSLTSNFNPKAKIKNGKGKTHDRRRTKDDLAALQNLIQLFQGLGKKVLVTSSNVIFEKIDGNIIFDWYVQREGESVFLEKELNRLAYTKRNTQRLKINEKVRQISQDNGVPYLDKFEYMCAKKLEECDHVTPDGYKVFYDTDHTTLEGAKYFGEKIQKTKWLEKHL